MSYCDYCKNCKIGHIANLIERLDRREKELEEAKKELEETKKELACKKERKEFGISPAGLLDIFMDEVMYPAIDEAAFKDALSQRLMVSIQNGVPIESWQTTEALISSIDSVDFVSNLKNFIMYMVNEQLNSIIDEKASCEGDTDGDE